MKNKINTRSSKGNTISWIIFLIIIVVIFGLLLIWQKNIQAPAVPSSQESQDEAKKTSKSFATEELSKKQKILQNQGYLHTAWSSGSLQACEQILDATLKQQCIDNINFALFSKGEDEALCEKLQDPALRQQCVDKIFYSAANSELNIEFCHKINAPDLKQNCLDKIQSILGKKAMTAAECNVITNPTLKSRCLDNLNYSSGVNGLNPESCNNIGDGKMRERCSAAVAQNIKVTELSKEQNNREYKSNAELIGECDGLGQDQAGHCKNESNFKLALEKRDLNYCNKIGDIQKRNECIQLQGSNINRFYLKQAIAKREISLCEKIMDDILKGTCMTYLQ